MSRRLRWLVALSCVFLARPGRAQAHHAGVPASIVSDGRAGPYVVSLWGTPDVGTSMLYVVFDEPDGKAFVAPTSVRVGVAPASGRSPEVVYDAHPERVRHGARFVAHVAFDRSEAWRVRVLAAGPAGAGEMRAQVRVTPAAALGPFGLALYAMPFVLVGGLWWRAAAARRAAALRPVLAAH